MTHAPKNTLKRPIFWTFWTCTTTFSRRPPHLFYCWDRKALFTIVAALPWLFDRVLSTYSKHLFWYGYIKFWKMTSKSVFVYIFKMFNYICIARYFQQSYTVLFSVNAFHFGRNGLKYSNFIKIYSELEVIFLSFVARVSSNFIPWNSQWKKRIKLWFVRFYNIQENALYSDNQQCIWLVLNF